MINNICIDNQPIISLMSGTSLDGLDLAVCIFNSENNIFKFQIIKSETIPYPLILKEKLKSAIHWEKKKIEKLDQEYGHFLGSQVLNFMKKHYLNPVLISSHGHTIKHQPEIKLTLQIGSGKEIRHITGISVVNNFRTHDLALGGQGAPLVPIGDELLFPQYSFCLNLGGFSNISFHQHHKRIACDLGPCNMLLNNLTQIKTIEYDRDGLISRTGLIVEELFNQWKTLDYYKLNPPKSLGREWFEKNFKIDQISKKYQWENLLRTSVEHIAWTVSEFVKKFQQDVNQTVLVTGGGTHNQFLLERIQSMLPTTIKLCIPDKQLVDYKEAIIFGFLGYLRVKNINNILSSVTGASHDHCSGDLYW